jgi:uncharacterized membrane protein
MSTPHILELTPRCSLTPATANVCVGVVGGTTFAVAGVFAAQGLWPALPFAGLEVALLAWAVRASLRAGSKRETIAIDADWITIRRTDRCAEHFSVFPRHGSRVTLRTPQTALHPRTARAQLMKPSVGCDRGLTLEHSCQW